MRSAAGGAGPGDRFESAFEITGAGDGEYELKLHPEWPGRRLGILASVLAFGSSGFTGRQCVTEHHVGVELHQSCYLHHLA